MSTPFKMKGSSIAKKKVDFNDPKVRANYEKHKDNKAYRDALNKKSGGETSYNKNTNTSTTKKNR